MTEDSLEGKAVQSSRGRLDEEAVSSGLSHRGRHSSSGHASPDPSTLHVVGIGASAGGLEALEAFFRRMPADCDLAFVVIQHLSPDFRSVMDELLSRHTPMAIHRVEDGMPVEANAIYLIPPKKEMVIEKGRLRLSDKNPSHGLTLPIDTFFRSLAQDVGDRSIAVVLSGTGSDGSRGLRDVHESGGLVAVQDPDSAKFDGMPRSAIDTGVVDLILAPDEMPSALQRYLTHSSDPPSSLVKEPLDGMEAIRSLLQREYGLDFSSYKPTTIHRRIERRMLIGGFSELSSYVELLSENRQELHSLYKDLLIGVTRFFRDEEAFERLEQKVLPALCADRDRDDELRIWVVGCATGEEAYSVAMIAHEYVQSLQQPLKVKIFATDVHRASLEFASNGCYSEASVSDLTRSRIERHFHRDGKGYRINTAIREMIVFAPHNLLRDAPFTRIDLVTCRNLLIYFQPPAQKKALTLFHFALRAGGFVMLGPSESPGELQAEFETVSTRWKIFRKTRDVRLPADIRIPVSSGTNTVRAPVPRTTPPDRRRDAANNLLFEHYVPPSLLVNEQYELLHSYAGGGKYLSIPDGAPAANILEMVPYELRLALTGALSRAQKEQQPAVYTGVTLWDRETDSQNQCKLMLTPVPVAELNETCYLISLEIQTTATQFERDGETLDMSDATEQQIQSLEEELKYTKENLQATLEEMETANEELQATNEELVASNEELQSTNEELHSVNEELYTVNAEYQRKIVELTELNNDMDNLLASTDVGTVFLDDELRVRKFTPQVAEIFHLLPGDVGRPLSGFTNTLEYPQLHRDLQIVLETQQRMERDIRDHKGRAFLVRILPYRDKAQKTTGVVVSLVDITQLKTAEKELRRMSTVFRDGADPILIEDLEGRITELNDEVVRVYGFRREELIGKHYSILVPPEYREKSEQLRRRCRKHEHVRNVELVRQTKRGEQCPVLLTLSLLVDDRGEPSAIATIAKDIRLRKQAEERARLAVQRRDEFLAMLSHELRNPLAAVLNAHRIIRSRLEDSETVSGASDVAYRQATQMARLLDDLLDVSRVVKGKIELKRKVVDLRKVGREAVEALQPSIEARRHHLEIEFPDQPVYVIGDPTRLMQIVENLLSNACKYTLENGYLKLELTFDASQAVLRVHDDGEGISPEVLPTIFEPFVQSKSTLDRSDGGMGVGLTLVHSLVELHGGSIDVRSSKQGSVFTVRLPSVGPPAAEELSPPVSSRSELSEVFRRILVVEDNADSRQTLAMLLRLDGFEVSTAEDGPQGLQAILEQQPDVALVDIGLPGLSGYDIAKRVRSEEGIRDQTLATRLVALTGYGRADDRQAALDAGFLAHLVKPLDPQQLYALLDQFRKSGSCSSSS